MHRRILIIIIVSVASLAAWSQSAKSDSLLKRLPGVKADTAKILLLCDIGESYENNEPATAKYYFNLAGKLSREIKYKWGEYKYLSLYGNVCMLQGNFDSSLYYQEKALAMAELMKDSLSIGISLFNIGINYRERSGFEKSIEYCLKGLTIIDKLGNPLIEAQVNDALQVLYYRRAQYQKAIGYGEKAVALARKLEQKELLAKFLINLSLSYQITNQWRQGVVALEEALRIGKAVGDVRVISVVQQNLAAVALQARNWPLAMQYAQESLVLYRRLGATDGETTALRSLATFSLQQGKLAQAKTYAHQALALSQTWQYKLEEATIYRLLSSIAYAEKEFEQGLQFDDSMSTKLEVMIREVSSQQSSELEKKYETEKKEIRIKQLEADQALQKLRIRQKNIINYILIGSAVSLLFIALLVWRNYRQKQALQQKRINELQTEKQLAATEAVLQGEEQERTRLAKDLHDGLGGMLSGIKSSFSTLKGNLLMDQENLRSFERGIDLLDSSISEMRRVAHNLMPEALVKFGLDTALRDFCSDIRQSVSIKLQYQSSGMENAVISSNTAIVIYRIVQELINNTLKHAGANTALVQLIKNESGITITVEDDGKGLDKARLQQPRGIGWSNIQSRIEYINGTMDIQSAPGKGTSILIELPV
ncbi:sensor histidine kinase [Paraflavitalea sp. CAU 1676]|uniref:tetratricopeptide repeat-containing sensor histidine kinase n=1 Tax=Paraflavitalea sp. CAU 1676 TaxID=3032598 RepID=UPI0023DCE704|nr:sensor histidine kinase [Paraflavitalea sp. CAU 1676]MDF2193709.1 sensor histidine kinase [Paraflavitalea sp. CAU 1676]